MADNEQNNDEYQFDNLDEISPILNEDNEELSANSYTKEDIRPLNATENNIKRNIFVGVAILIFTLVVYKFLAASFSSKKLSDQVVPAVKSDTATATAPVIPQAQPEQPVAQVVVPVTDEKTNQALGAIEVTQQSLRTGITSINDQLGGINSNLNAMMTKITELNGIIVSLSTKVEEQAIVIAKLTVQNKPKQKHEARKYTQQRLKFYLQAVIPGRAWLIATNGTTLTVREGTTIQGYGMVKLIDPTQGRVTTSSGQVIRFSQEDS